MYISWNNFDVGRRRPPGDPLGRRRRDLERSGRPSTTPASSATSRSRSAWTGPSSSPAWTRGGGGLGNRTNIIYRSTNGGRDLDVVTTGAAFPGPGQSTCGYFAAHVPVVLAAHGLGRRRRRPERDRPLRLRAARRGLRLRRHLLRSLHRQRRDLEHAAQAGHGRRHALAVAAVALGLAGRQPARQLVRRPQHLGQRPTSASPASRRTTARRGQRRGHERRRSARCRCSRDPNVQPCYTGDYDRSYSNNAAHYVLGWTGAC